MTRFLGVLGAAALVAACATQPSTVAPVATPIDPAFEAAGRLSARHGSEGVAVNFTWRHTALADDFDVATPLGQTVARMRRDTSGVHLQRPNEAVVTYPDWGTLTASVLGVPIPVNGLVAWIQAAPDGQAAQDIERDNAGRPLVLRQQGWEIVYAYPDERATRPMRLVMRYPGSDPIEVRLVVDRWTSLAPS